MSARTLSSRRIYTGKVLDLEVDEVEEPGGVRGVREVVRQKGSVAAVAVRDDGQVVLVRQYRHAVGDSLWELPAGRLDPGEEPETGARRELAEEVGVRAGSIEKVADFYTTPGFCDERMSVYRATGLLHGQADPDEDERLEVRWFSLDEVRAMIADGGIREGKTLVGLLLELQRRG